MLSTKLDSLALLSAPLLLTPLLGSLSIEVAGNLVPAAYLYEWGLDLGANWLDIGAAGVKAATRGWIEGAGHLPGEDDLLPLNIGVGRKSG